MKQQWATLHFCSVTNVPRNKGKYENHLLRDVVNRASGIAILQLPVHLVAQQRQAAVGLQYPLNLLQEPWAVKPVGRRHSRYKVHLAGLKRQLLCRTLTGCRRG